MFCKIIFKVFAFKIEFTFLVTICGLLFTLFTGSLNRGCEKTSVLILKKKTISKNSKNSQEPRSSHRRCSRERSSFRMSQSSQVNICVRVSFLIKLQAILLENTSKPGVSSGGMACNFIKKTYL